MTNITQEDRDAAASGYFAWCSGNPVIPGRMTSGKADDHSMVQAFARHREAAAAKERERIVALEAEVARLRKMTRGNWFYHPDETDRCWFSPDEVIDEMYDPEPGDHVLEVDCAASLPSIWCAVRVTDDPDADERFTFTEHASEAEARAFLEANNATSD